MKVEGRTRPGANSLRLLPLGPDRIGEATARADLPGMVVGDPDRKSNLNAEAIRNTPNFAIQR